MAGVPWHRRVPDVGQTVCESDVSHDDSKVSRHPAIPLYPFSPLAPPTTTAAASSTPKTPSMSYSRAALSPCAGPSHINRGRPHPLHAADAVSDNNNALYDQTLPRSTAIGMLHNQIFQRFSHAAVIGSASSVLDVLHRNFYIAPLLILSVRALHRYALGS